MKTFIRVLVFYAVTFFLTILLSVVQQAFGLNAGVIVLPQFAPGLAALILVALFRKDAIKLAVSPKGLSAQQILGALGIPLLISLSLVLVYGGFVAGIKVPTVDPVALVILLGGMLLGAFGEELGWRAYLQNMLDRRIGALAAFVLTGMLWGLWHVGNYANGPAYMLWFLLFTIGCSGVLGGLIRGSGYNVTLAGLFHFAVNAGLYVLKDAVADPRLMALTGVLWMGAALIVVVIRRKDFLRLPGRSGEETRRATAAGM